MGGTLVNAGGSPLFVYGEGPFRVGRFYMIANISGKVSNLTVAPHQFIPSTLHHEQGAPLLASLARATGDTLLTNYTLAIFTQGPFYTASQQHTGDTL